MLKKFKIRKSISPTQSTIIGLTKKGPSYCAMSVNGSRVVSINNEGILKTWNTRQSWKKGPAYYAMSVNGSRVVSINNEGILKTWNTRQSWMKKGLNGEYSLDFSDENDKLFGDCAISSDGSTVVTYAFENSIVIRTSLKTLESESFLVECNARDRYVTAVGSNTDASIIVLGYSKQFQVLNCNTKTNWFFSLGGFRRDICKITISPDGSKVVFATLQPSGGEIVICNLQDYDSEPEKILTGYNSCVSSLAISSDNSIVISGHYDGSIRVWNLESCKCEKELKEHVSDEKFSGMVFGVSISNDKSTIISGSQDGTIRQWNLTE
jgi:WD40 repeat protein